MRKVVIRAPDARLKDACGRGKRAVSTDGAADIQTIRRRTFGFLELDDDCVFRRTLLVPDLLYLESEFPAGVPRAGDMDMLRAVFALDRRPDILLLAERARRVLPVRGEQSERFDGRDDRWGAELKLSMPDGAEEMDVAVRAGRPSGGAPPECGVLWTDLDISVSFMQSSAVIGMSRAMSFGVGHKTQKGCRQRGFRS